MLLGCSAGFLNSIKIKGSHTALKSGLVAGDEVFAAFEAAGTDATGETYEIADPGTEVSAVRSAVMTSCPFIPITPNPALCFFITAELDPHPIVWKGYWLPNCHGRLLGVR